MIVFFLNDVRKSYYMISLFFSLEKSINKSIFVYNEDQSKFSFGYLNSLKKTFFKLRFISLKEFLKNNKKVKLFFFDLDFYSKSDLRNISKIDVSKKILLLNNNVGIEAQENSSLLLKPDKYIVWNKNFIYHLIKSRKSKINLQTTKTIYYNKHINKNFLFEHKNIDYLFFLPTKLSFQDQKDIGIFLIDVYDFLSNNKFKVYFKPHQRAQENYLIPKSKFITYLTYIISRLPFNFFSFVLKFSHLENLNKFLNYSLFAKIKVDFHFESLRYSLIPIEFYFPFIKKKIIGGFSNSLIISSYLNIKVKLFGNNKIPLNFIKKKKVISSEIYLKTNMDFFKHNNGYDFSKNAFKNENFIRCFKPQILIEELIK